MNVIVYIDSLAPSGGQERVVSQHVRFLIAEGYFVQILVKDNGEYFYELPDSCEFIALHSGVMPLGLSRWRRLLFRLRSVRKNVSHIASILRDVDFDFLYASSPLNVFELWCAGVDLSDVVISEHSSFSAHNRFYKMCIEKLYGRARAFLVPTLLDCKTYEEKGLRPSYVPNPVSIPTGDVRLRQEKIVLNVGRFCHDKRQLHLLDLWSRAKCRNDGWELHIYGSGELSRDLSDYILKYKLDDSVKIFPPTADIEEVYERASLFLLASKAEGFGMVLAEAHSHGVPCISYDVPSGPRDIIVHGDNGFLIDEGDEEGYVRALDLLCNDSGLRESFSRSAKVTSYRFDERVISKRFIDALHVRSRP